MKYIEKLKQEYPDAVDENFAGGAAGCPRSWGYEEKLPCMDRNISCEECWKRKMEGTANEIH